MQVGRHRPGDRVGGRHLGLGREVEQRREAGGGHVRADQRVEHAVRERQRRAPGLADGHGHAADRGERALVGRLAGALGLRGDVEVADDGAGPQARLDLAADQRQVHVERPRGRRVELAQPEAVGGVVVQRRGGDHLRAEVAQAACGHAQRTRPAGDRDHEAVEHPGHRLSTPDPARARAG